MTKLYFLIAILLLFSSEMFAQIGINTDNSTPDPSAMLDVKSNSKGLLIPRLTQDQISAITTPANGLVVFCNTDNKLYLFLAGANVWKEVSYGTATIATFPAVTTAAISTVTPTTATVSGNVTSDGGATVTARGVCWSLSANPTTADSHTTDGTGTGAYVSNLTGLTQGNSYYARAYATNSVGTSYGSQTSFFTYFIGQNYGGGIIFYTDGTGQHGLISSTSDQGTAVVWGCYNTSIPGTSTAIGTGQANTTAIVAGCATTGIAAQICDALVLNGYSDWFLPSKDELNQMYLQKAVIGSFASNYYRSSSENSAILAWVQSLYNGTQNTLSKNSIFCVRAVRSF